jgi:peptidoglycan/LPS O-acetylase OafA/YrhL
VPALDGLRGIAVLGVLFYHADGALKGGYLGVDLFFVLSGFLITSLLLGEHHRTGRIDLRAFWVRRARRLFPALLLFMVAIAVYSRVLASPRELCSIRADALATLGYVANWHTIWTNRSYWDLFVSPSPLEHTWSLAIEEQFYVVWPLVVALTLRYRTCRTVLWVALVATALSMVAMVVSFDHGGASRAYLGTDTRASGILSGAALAALAGPGTRFASFLNPGSTLSAKAIRVVDAAAVLALVGLGAAWFDLEGEDPLLYRGGFWFTQLCALVLIVCATLGSRSALARALAFEPLSLLGKVSYGVYLWHWPVYLALTAERIHLDGIALHALRFAATFALAAISYRLVEQPIRTRGLPFGRPIIVVPSAVAVVVAGLLGATLPRPAAARLAASVPIPERLLGVEGDFSVMLLGDSTANSLGWALRGLRDPRVSVELRGHDACNMLLDACESGAWAELKRSARPDATLVFVGGAFLYGRTIDGRWRRACYPGWNRAFEHVLERRLAELAGTPGTVWAVTVPYPLGQWDNASHRAEVDCINGSIRKTSAAAGVRILDLAELLCPKGACEREREGEAIRPDGVHYDLVASHVLARRVLQRILD